MNKKILMLVLLLVMSLSVYTVHAQDTQTGKNAPTVEVETIEVPEGIITITKVEYSAIMGDNPIDSILSEIFFYDDLYQTCNNGAEFKFSAIGAGTVDWRLDWSGGWTANNDYCPGTPQCHYTITTSWSAFYTDAFAHTYTPQNLDGPDDAYKCR